MSAPEIHLTETAPGSWEMPRRLTGYRQDEGCDQSSDEPSKEELSARREAFFNSLAGEARKPPPDAWWAGWTGVAILASCFGALIVLTMPFQPETGAGLHLVAALLLASTLPVLAALIKFISDKTLRIY